MSSNPDGSSATDIQFVDDKPIVSIFDFFDSEIVLLRKTFRNVYGHSTTDLQYDQYSEVHINLDVGVVGFRDANNELWVFDGFE